MRTTVEGLSVRGRRLALSTAAAAAAACVVLVTPVAAKSAGRGHATARQRSVVPRRGIGVVRLGEPRRQVVAALGRGRRIAKGPNAGEVRYRVGTLSILVAYGGKGRVAAVSTMSRTALLYGHPLGDGLAALEPLLKAHGWRVLRCNGEVFTSLIPGGPGTGIAWRDGKLKEVVVSAGGSWGEWCASEYSLLRRR